MTIWRGHVDSDFWNLGADLKSMEWPKDKHDDDHLAHQLKVHGWKKYSSRSIIPRRQQKGWDT
jgi:hypothetical protein